MDSYDWHDYTQVKIETISRDGKRSVRFLQPQLGALRTNTLSPLEGEAYSKIAFWSIFTPTKETGSHDGYALTTSDKLYTGNEHNLNASGRVQSIDVDGIIAAFNVATAAGGVNGTKSVSDAAAFLRDGTISAGGDEQALAPIKVGKKTEEVDSCPGCHKVGSRSSMINENHPELIPIKQQSTESK